LAHPHDQGAGSQSTGRADLHDLSVVKQVDIATPFLFKACANGSHIKSAVLSLNEATGKKSEYMKIKLTDVFVTSLRPGGSAQGVDGRPLEELSLSYSKIEMEYSAFDKAGKSIGKAPAFYDLATSKAG
jgi:type VI secretion system secreted protein Hcp